MTKLKYILLFLFFGIVIAACNRVADPCLQPRNVYMLLGTYRPADTGSNGVDSFLPKGILRYVDNGIIADSGAKKNKFFIQLSPQATVIKLLVSTDSTIAGTDTITFEYDKKLTFISTACGYIYHYAIKNVAWTNYNIDSVVVKNAEINGAANIEHAKIFY